MGLTFDAPVSLPRQVQSAFPLTADNLVSHSLHVHKQQIYAEGQQGVATKGQRGQAAALRIYWLASRDHHVTDIKWSPAMSIIGHPLALPFTALELALCMN